MCSLSHPPPPRRWHWPRAYVYWYPRTPMILGNSYETLKGSPEWVSYKIVPVHPVLGHNCQYTLWRLRLLYRHSFIFLSVWIKALGCTLGLELEWQFFHMYSLLLASCSHSSLKLLALELCLCFLGLAWVLFWVGALICEVWFLEKRHIWFLASFLLGPPSRSVVTQPFFPLVCP